VNSLLPTFPSVIFHFFLEGSPFTLFTDHKPFVAAITKTGTSYSSQQQRHLFSSPSFPPYLFTFPVPTTLLLISFHVPPPPPLRFLPLLSPQHSCQSDSHSSFLPPHSPGKADVPFHSSNLHQSFSFYYFHSSFFHSFAPWRCFHFHLPYSNSIILLQAKIGNRTDSVSVH
jgi:hypothetical protein